jgi:hypothetical protein
MVAQLRKVRWTPADHAIHPNDHDGCLGGRAVGGQDACPDLALLLEQGEGDAAKSRPWYPMPVGVKVPKK